MNDRACGIESFRGDFDALASMMKQSWAENEQQSLAYDRPFLRSAFQYPGAAFTLAPTIYVNDMPAAFVAGFPRTVRFDGRDWRLLCVTFWTTSASFKGKGYGSRVWMDVLRRARELGYDGTVNYCVDGARSNEIVVACGKNAGAEVHRVFSAQYVARLLRPPSASSMELSSDVLDVFLAAATRVSPSVPMARVWSREEAAWQCFGREGTLFAVHRNGSISGVVTGYLVDVVQNTPTKVLLIDDLLWDGLPSEEQLVLLQALLLKGAAAGARLAVAPLMGYTRSEALVKAGFRRSRRLMHMYPTVWNDADALRSLSSVYLDVF